MDSLYYPSFSICDDFKYKNIFLEGRVNPSYFTLSVVRFNDFNRYESARARVAIKTVVKKKANPTLWVNDFSRYKNRAK